MSIPIIRYAPEVANGEVPMGRVAQGLLPRCSMGSDRHDETPRVCGWGAHLSMPCSIVPVVPRTFTSSLRIGLAPRHAFQVHHLAAAHWPLRKPLRRHMHVVESIASPTGLSTESAQRSARRSRPHFLKACHMSQNVKAS